jgi:hypothetical protein
LLAAASLAAVASVSTHAAVVDSGTVSIAIPATTSGVYLNVVTGVSAPTPGAAPGWDFNPWGSTLRTFFWPTAPANSFGGDATGGTVYRLLNPGDTVGPASTFITSAASAQAVNFNTGTPGQKIVGFRFNNEAGTTTNFGYAVLSSANASGVPGTIVRYVYESTPNTAITIAGGATPPTFAYVPATGATVDFTGGGAIGSTGNGTITVSLGTPAGSGTGAAATTTLTCTAPTAPFTGFAQSINAVGPGALSGTTLSGSCTLGAAAATQTLTCNENRGGTANALTWTLSCPAGAATPLTSTPVSGSTVTTPPRAVGGPASTATIQFQNPGVAAATVTCTAPAATQFTVTPLSIPVPAGGSGSTTVSYTNATPGTTAGVLNCTAGAQQFTFNLSGTTLAAAAAISVPVFSGNGLWLALLMVFGLGMAALLVRRD